MVIIKIFTRTLRIDYMVFVSSHDLGATKPHLGLSTPPRYVLMFLSNITRNSLLLSGLETRRNLVIHKLAHPQKMSLLGRFYTQNGTNIS